MIKRCLALVSLTAVAACAEFAPTVRQLEPDVFAMRTAPGVTLEVLEWRSAGGQLALLLGTTADSGDPSASDAVLREGSRVAAVVAYFPPTDLSRFVNRRSFPATAALTEAEAALFSPIRFVSPGAAPSLIVHGDADSVVPMVEGETMHSALTKAGVTASFMRIERAGHGFEGAELERVSTAMVQWFERHLASAAK